MMEIIAKSSELPRQLTAAERKQRLDTEKKLSEEAVSKLETELRRGLWKNHLDDVRLIEKTSSREQGRHPTGIATGDDQSL